MLKINRGWTSRIVVRYSLLQLPALFLLVIGLFIASGFIDLPYWVFLILLVSWITKDIVLFPFVWQAYDTRDRNKFAQLVGKNGVIVVTPDPIGTVLINGEFWQAKLKNPVIKLSKGTAVQVVNCQNLILTVSEINDK